MSEITLPATVDNSCSFAEFRLDRAQDTLLRHSGVSQVTTYTRRLWATELRVVYQATTNLFAWSLALDQLSDLDNHFVLQPPHYTGPATGYSGSSPLVAGADQTGLTLDVDTLDLSTAILTAGDFFSFDVTTTEGNTNRQLNRCTADVTSDGAGAATINCLLPIRQAPANNAAVNIQTPSAFFRLTSAVSRVQLQQTRLSPFTVPAVERMFP